MEGGFKVAEENKVRNEINTEKGMSEYEGEDVG